ncbi:MAG: ABC transporter permease [Limisphaerales bacterium]|jgi:ABC-2 type transport system permease protein
MFCSQTHPTHAMLSPAIDIAMGKYAQVMLIGLQNTLTYRVNFLVRSTFGLVPMLATILVWKAIYADQPGNASIAGYTLNQMITYYLVVSLVDMLTAVTDDDWQIAADIREGNISQFLLKPINYLLYRLCLYGSGRVIYTSVAILPVGLFAFFLREHLVPPDSLLALTAFTLSILLTALLQFLISFTMAMLAFWILEVSTFIFILFALEFLAGGHLFPLDILPPAIQTLLYLTPFPYQMFFPVSVYLGRLSGPEMLQGLAIQAGWVVIAAVMARTAWQRGLKKYAAFGG